MSIAKHEETENEHYKSVKVVAAGHVAAYPVLARYTSKYIYICSFLIMYEVRRASEVTHDVKYLVRSMLHTRY